MSARSILALVKVAQAELGITQATSVFSAGAQATDTQMGALANRVLDEMRRMYIWSPMQKEFDIVVTTPMKTTGNMAANSAVITNIPSTAGLMANQYAVTGSNIPQAARVLSVDSGTQVTMTMQNTNTSPLTGTAITFAKDTYALPTDFDWYNNGTMWDRTNFWKLLGPDSAQRDQWIRSGIRPLTPRRHWRQLGALANQWRIWPPPTEISNPLQLVFEYLSTNAVAVNGSPTSFAQYFANDLDTCLLDENALILGIKWMFWEIKGFGSYITMQNRWVDYVNRLGARDGGAQILSMAQREAEILISPANVQDGNFPAGAGSG
jgi:hypothetical protein